MVYFIYYVYSIEAINDMLLSRTGQRIVHVESIKFDVLQVQTPVDENSGIKTIYCLH